MGAPCEPRIDVSIIIVHFRTPELLQRCLETIAAARVLLAHEILVEDNAPLDGRAAELAARLGARYRRHDENLGLGRAVNQGLAAARGRYLLNLNPDIEVRPGSIEALVGFMDAHPAVGIAGPRLLDPDGSLQYSARTFYTLRVILLRRTFLGRLFPRARALREHLMMDWDHQEARDVDWMLGGALCVRREACQDVGGMDERFFLYFEDVDWCGRMQRRGWRVVYVPQAEMVHAHQRASARGFLSRGQRAHLESGLRFWEKWGWVFYLGRRHATGIRVAATLALDLALLSAAFLAAYFTRYALGLLIPNWSEAKPLFALRVYARFIPFAGLVALLTFRFLGLYRREVWSEPWRELGQLFKGVAITSLVVLASTFLFASRPMSRFTIVLFFPYALIGVALGRALLRRLVAGVKGRRLHLRRIAIFAARGRIDELRRRFAEHGTFGYEPLFLAHDDEQRRAGLAGDPLERRVRFLGDERAAEAVLCDDPGDGAFVARLLPRLLATRLPVLYIPQGEAALRGARPVRDFMGYGAISLQGGPQSVRSPAKRLIDVGLALALLALGWPLHLLQLLAQRGAGCVSETLVGRRGRPLRRPRYAGSGGPAARIPWLRHYPALGRVLTGEMSIAGIIPLTAETFALTDEDYRREPPDAPVGIFTAAGGCAQGGQAAAVEIARRNRQYVERWSLSEDLRLVAAALRRGSRRGGGQA